MDPRIAGTRQVLVATIVIAWGCGATPTSERIGATAPPGRLVASEGAQNESAPSTILDAGTTPSEDPALLDTIAVAPGFRPDPIVRRGRAGGPRDAEHIDPSCRGHIAAEPNHILKVDAVVPDLRVLASIHGGDATLLIELANGGVLCNDDSEGLNPIVAGHLPIGRHRVFVGTYSPTDPGGEPYTLAFTATPTLSTTQLDATPVTP